MALPPIDTNTDLEAEDELEPTGDEGSRGDAGSESMGDVDPMFAADVAEAFPDLDDGQIAALQRAFLGLMSGPMGGGAPPAAGGMPF